MDSLKSLIKGYGKVDLTEGRQFRPKTKNRSMLIAVTGVLLLAIIAGVTIFVPGNKRTGESSSLPQSPISTSSSIKVVCSFTRYPDSCIASLSSASANSSAVTSDPVVLFQISLSVASHSISKLSAFLSTLDIPVADNLLKAVIRDCKELLDDAIDRLNDSSAVLTKAKQGEKILSDSKINDLKTWLSATITDQETCLNGFEGTTGGFREKLEAAMVNSTRFTSNSLAIAAGILGIMEKLHLPINRKLLSTIEQRRTLFAGEIEAAKDGSGMIHSIQEVVDMVPRRSNSPFSVHLKKGECEEIMAADQKKWDAAMTGNM